MTRPPFTIFTDLDVGSRIGHFVADEGGADVTIQRGQVPKRIDGTWVSPGYIFAPDRCLVTVAGGARFLVEHGRQVRYDPADSNLDDVRLILLGTVFAILCYQRGLLPLHASAVIQDGVVHAFTAGSGGGKSTLAAALSRQSWDFFADDIVLVPGVVDDDHVFCWSGQRDLKLWRNALPLVQLNTGEPVADMTGRDKVFAIPARMSAQGNGILSTLTVLESASTPAISTLQASNAISAIMAAAYRPEVCAHLCGAAWLFRAAGRLASRIEVRRFERPMTMKGFDDGVDAIHDVIR